MQTKKYFKREIRDYSANGSDFQQLPEGENLLHRWHASNGAGGR
jgi:hypothetical protein